ncbi:MAG: hypothetical protein ABJA90_05025 [Ginsengibacter sp.]
MINRKTARLTYIIFAAIPLFFFAVPAFSQVYGCTDSLANNYNAAASANDGSCTYNAVNYTPQIKVDPIDNVLIESSGLQMAGNFLWTFNDGGGAAAIYRIDTLTNALLQTVTLSGASNMDWEDIAFDGTYFYVGDFGNNADGARADLKIYKFPLSAIPAYTVNANPVIPPGQIQVINFSYADQPQPLVASGSNNTKYDCEAMIVDGGKIHLFTKNWIDLTSTHYVINSTLPGNYVLSPLETLPVNFLVTGADIAPMDGTIILIGYQNSGFGNHYLYLLSDYNGGFFFNGNKRKINLPAASVMGQSEGVTFRNNTYGYISNEKFYRNFGFFVIDVNQKLRSFDIGSLVNASRIYRFTGVGNWDVPSHWSNNTIPPAQLSAGSQVIIDPPLGQDCILNVSVTLPAGVELTIVNGKSFVIQGKLTVQ